MKHMKKIVFSFLLVLALSATTACGWGKSTGKNNMNNTTNGAAGTNTNDVNGTGSGVHTNTNGTTNRTVDNNGAINDVGNGIVNGVENIGNGVRNGVEDLTNTKQEVAPRSKANTINQNKENNTTVPGAVR